MENNGSTGVYMAGSTSVQGATFATVRVSLQKMTKSVYYQSYPIFKAPLQFSTSLPLPY